VTITRRTVLLALAGAVVAAAALAAALVLVSRGGHEQASTATTATRAPLLAGVPQNGLELGNPAAPALYEYADMQCPYCADFSRLVFPTVVRDYVRTGKVKLVFHGLAFVGPDSEKALRAVFAAGSQNRLWDVVDELYARQGAENGGWVTDSLLQEVGSGAGLDVGRWQDEFDSSAVAQHFQSATQAATEAGIRGTPSFVFDGRQLPLRSLDPGDFSQLLDEQLAG